MSERYDDDTFRDPAAGLAAGSTGFSGDPAGSREHAAEAGAEPGGVSGVPASGDPAESGLVVPGGGQRVFDHARIERAVREILIAIGEDPDRDGLRETPARVARAYAEQFAGLRQNPEDALNKVFEADHDEMVLVKDIEVYSMCEHHLTPFHGLAHVGYTPNEKGQITGLSKLARLVDVFARRPQVQERLTSQIADALMRILEPRGVIVVIEAEHLCMTMRGVRKPGAKTVTSAVRGAFRDRPETRAEAMGLILGG
ncbi:hypothetical protein Acsp04_55910 [Actinomadura sp. NBRC 104425]|nr:hypothetical protein Acsp04_55910 [Actinomadura sp. NBRC 104425]